jgi:hypothetical protein
MKIELYTHPFAGIAPQVFVVQSLAHWLHDRYATRQGRLNIQVFAGPASAETALDTPEAIMECTAPVVTVLESPGDPISILVNIAISFVLKLVASALSPSPTTPANVNRVQESPNNALGQRNNQVRLGQRIEDIYGDVKSIPSLLMPTYYKYVSNTRQEYGYYCIGRGYYTVSDLSDGETLLSDTPTASAAVYAPFTSPNFGTPQITVGAAIIDSIVGVERSASVDGNVLLALNQVQLPAAAPYILVPPGTSGSPAPSATYDVVYQATWSGSLASAAPFKKPNLNAIALPGQSLTIGAHTPIPVVRVPSGTVTADATTGRYIVTDRSLGGLKVGSTLLVDGFLLPVNNGTKTVTAVWSVNSVVVSGSLLAETASSGTSFSFDADYGGTVRTIGVVGDGYVELTDILFGGADPLPITCDAVVANGLTDWTAWYTLRSLTRTQVWANIIAPQGLYKDSGGKSAATVAYTLEIEQLTAGLAPTGTVESVSSSLSGATSVERAETLEHVTAWTGPARVRMRRTTPADYDFSGTVVDEVRWADVYAVSPVTQADFGDITTIHTQRSATRGVVAASGGALSCLAQRMLPQYLGYGTAFSGTIDDDGRHVGGTLVATSKMVDIIAAMASDVHIGGLDLATELDLPQIYSQQLLLDAWHADAGTFNYTFDSSDIGFEEMVTAVASACFCRAYRQNGYIRVWHERAQATPTALFTHRNKRPNAETITRSFATDGDYDQVKITYRDSISHRPEVITLPSTDIGRAKAIELTGVTSFAQAWYHANRELEKLLAQRITISTDTTTDARGLLPGGRVDIVDNTVFKSYDGEIVGQSGMELTLSRAVAFEPSGTHSIVLVQRNGTPQGIACTAGSAPNKIVLLAVPAEAVVSELGNDGIRTMFGFAADTARAAQAYIVQEIGASDGQYINIRATNYTPNFYAADAAAVPSRESIIF